MSKQNKRELSLMNKPKQEYHHQRFLQFVFVHQSYSNTPNYGKDNIHGVESTILAVGKRGRIA
jgi:hypothetical protein